MRAIFYKNLSKYTKTIFTLIFLFIVIIEFLPSANAITKIPTLPYLWLIEESNKNGEFSYMEIPARIDYTDKLYLYNHSENITILNPYLQTSNEVKIIETSLWNMDIPIIPDSLWCNNFRSFGGKYILYHEKELNKKLITQKFIENKTINDNLKVAISETWGYPIWGTHKPLDENESFRKQRELDLINLLLQDPKFELIKHFSQEEIAKARKNNNFSGDKFGATYIFAISDSYCDEFLSKDSLSN